VSLINNFESLCVTLLSQPDGFAKR